MTEPTRRPGRPRKATNTLSVTHNQSSAVESEELTLVQLHEQSGNYPAVKAVQFMTVTDVLNLNGLTRISSVQALLRVSKEGLYVASLDERITAVDLIPWGNIARVRFDGTP